MTHPVPRCPICSHAGWHQRGAMRECTHCELAVRADTATATVRNQIDAALDTAGRDHAEGDSWHLSAVALRNAAWALGRCWVDAAWRRQSPVGHDIVLGVIGRPSDLPAIVALAGTAGFERTVAVLDGSGPPPPVPSSQLLLASHPLDGDFARQRNRLQRLAEADRGAPCWVLQLDTDERPSPALLDALGWMVRAADRERLRSIGLPRSNLVDGVPSALFPDIQYRLNRSDMRFEGVVHERPSVLFAHTTLGLCGVIEHRLDRARVLARSIAYEAMHPGAGRSMDERALLQPFDPAIGPAG